MLAPSLEYLLNSVPRVLPNGFFFIISFLLGSVLVSFVVSTRLINTSDVSVAAVAFSLLFLSVSASSSSSSSTTKTRIFLT